MNNNFYTLRSLMAFTDPGDFYCIEIIQRKKDNPTLFNKSSRKLKMYTVYSKNELDDLQPRIIQDCEVNRARAYIRVNKRNDKIVALDMMERLANTIKTGAYRNAKLLYDKSIGNTVATDKTNRRWLIDVDNEDNLTNMDFWENQVHPRINLINSLRPVGSKIISIVNTKNGLHLITSPFDVKGYTDAGYPKDEIGKDNPTLLYIPI